MARHPQGDHEARLRHLGRVGHQPRSAAGRSSEGAEAMAV